MSIAAEFRGKAFLQIAPRLRWKDGPNGETESFRPIDDLTGNVVGDPPAIGFHDQADVDVQHWLDRGRIKPAPAGTKPGKPMTDTEAHAKPAKAEAEAEGEG